MRYIQKLKIILKKFMLVTRYEVGNASVSAFKNHQSGVIVNLGYVAQYSYNAGYSTYEKIEKNSDLITYKVHIKGLVMGDNLGCDTIYEYNLEKSNDGKLCF